MEILFWLFWLILIAAVVVFVAWYLKSRKTQEKLPMKMEGGEEKTQNPQT